MSSVVPGGRAISAAGSGSPVHTTSVGGSSRERAADSAVASDCRTASGVAASTPSAPSTATTVSSGTDTVTSADGE